MERLSAFLHRITQLIGDYPALNLAARSIFAVLIALVAWIVIRALINILKRRMISVRAISIDDKIWGTVRKVLNYGLLLVVGTYLIRLLEFRLIEKLFPAFIIVLLSGPINSFLLIVLGYLERKWADKTETKIDNILFDLLNKFSGAIIYIVSVIIALDILGINVMPFVAGAGVMGVAVGFAAKDTLSNLIAGILLIIDRPFEIGDRIEVWSAPAGCATWGDVIDIGLRATKIKTTDNIIIVIPNNEIMKRDIVNYTLISSQIRVRINIGVAYDTPIEKSKQVLLSVAAQAEWISKTPKPKVVVRNFGESSVDLQLRVWINDARQRMNTISFVTDRAKSEFEAHGIEIPYPKRDIHIIQKIPQGNGSLPSPIYPDISQKTPVS
jgi:small-conductance mechanosensitive channel